jgi:hypothetical protein
MKLSLKKYAHFVERTSRMGGWGGRAGERTCRVSGQLASSRAEGEGMAGAADQLEIAQMSARASARAWGAGGAAGESASARAGGVGGAIGLLHSTDGQKSRPPPRDSWPSPISTSL